MSTDLSLSVIQILNYYRARFQIDFLYRDGKQFTGLNDCQARSENKLDFQFNMSLTSINITKKLIGWPFLKNIENHSQWLT
jgi:hypothetical protein